METKNNENILINEISMYELEPRLELVAAASKKTVSATPVNDGATYTNGDVVTISF